MTDEESRKAFANWAAHCCERADRDIAEYAWQAAIAWMQGQQEWRPQETAPIGRRVRVLLVDGSMLNEVIPQADGDFWWDGCGRGEMFIFPDQVEGWLPLPPLPKEKT